MNTGRTVFAQLMDFLPMHEFRKCIRRYHGHHKVQGVFCLDQFLHFLPVPYVLVTRAKTNLRYRRVYSHPVDRPTGVTCDQTIVLTCPRTAKDYPDKIRLDRYFDAEAQKELGFLTNDCSLPALTITQLHKSLWQVELFFKWIKPHLTALLVSCVVVMGVTAAAHAHLGPTFFAQQVDPATITIDGKGDDPGWNGPLWNPVNTITRNVLWGTNGGRELPPVDDWDAILKVGWSAPPDNIICFYTPRSGRGERDRP